MAFPPEGWALQGSRVPGMLSKPLGHVWIVGWPEQLLSPPSLCTPIPAESMDSPTSTSEQGQGMGKTQISFSSGCWVDSAA